MASGGRALVLLLVLVGLLVFGEALFKGPVPDTSEWTPSHYAALGSVMVVLLLGASLFLVHRKHR